jgi:hypothetical protein
LDRFFSACCAVGDLEEAAGLEQRALGQAELGARDVVGAIAGHQAAQLVAAPHMALLRAGDRWCFALGAGGYDHGVRAQLGHQRRRGCRAQPHFDRQLPDLVHQVVEQRAVLGIGQRRRRTACRRGGRCARPA